MDLQLKDRIALVTGASRGLGAATAELLSSEGARVVINSRDACQITSHRSPLQKKTGNPVIAISGDVSNPDFPTQLIAQVVQQLGGLDILITNAGDHLPVDSNHSQTPTGSALSRQT